MPDTETQAEVQIERERGNRKSRTGHVLSNKMDKTIVVRVERRIPHPRYKKVITRYSKLYAHDEKREAKIGDKVRVQECRPLSKTKRWRLIEVINPSDSSAAAAA